MYSSKYDRWLKKRQKHGERPAVAVPRPPPSLGSHCPACPWKGAFDCAVHIRQGVVRCPWCGTPVTPELPPFVEGLG